MKTISILFALSTASHAATFLKIEAGQHDRLQTPVTVSIPSDAPENPALKTPEGDTLPLQLSDDRTAIFILPELAAGKSARFELVSLPEPAGDNAVAASVEKDDSVDFKVSGAPVATMIGKVTELPRKDIEPIFLRGGYLHPLFSPSGDVVTGDYPKDHLHHHGIWTAWTKAVFQDRKTDFWNMGKGLGKVDSKGIDFSWSGPVHAGMESENDFTDLTSGSPMHALNELWTLKVFAIPVGEKPYRLVELTSMQFAADGQKLELPEYHYGGLGIRGRDEWNGKENAGFLTSEGVTDRDAANGKPARWIAMFGETGKGKSTLAILGSPENFRTPQPVRVHPTEPFVCFAPQSAGDMAIRHGEDYISKYRFVTTDGEPDKELLDRLWNDYAEPPSATWE